MKINIKATNIELTDAIRGYAEGKVQSLEKILPLGDESAIADVEVGKESNHHQQGEDEFRAEINLHFSRHNLYAAEHHSDLYAAIDLVRDEMAREINSRIEKKNTLVRRGGRAIKNMLHGINPWRKKS